MQSIRRTLVASLVLASALPLAALAQAPAASSCTPKGTAPMKVKLTTSMGPIVIQLDKERQRQIDGWQANVKKYCE